MAHPKDQTILNFVRAAAGEMNREEPDEYVGKIDKLLQIIYGRRMSSTDRKVQALVTSSFQPEDRYSLVNVYLTMLVNDRQQPPLLSIPAEVPVEVLVRPLLLPVHLMLFVTKLMPYERHIDSQLVQNLGAELNVAMESIEVDRLVNLYTVNLTPLVIAKLLLSAYPDVLKEDGNPNL
ncbi:unnamed protein product, partial [Mesorhabditis spiculigera]